MPDSEEPLLYEFAVDPEWSFDLENYGLPALSNV
jgi:hypothetical protein